MKKKSFVAAFLVVLFLGALLYMSGNPKLFNGNKVISFSSAPFEVEPQFLITPESEIVFSASSSSDYHLYSLKNGMLTLMDDFRENSFYPFLANGSVAALTDNEGNEEFHSTSHELEKLIGNQPIEKVFAFNKGTLLIIKFKYNTQVFSIDLKNNYKKVLLNNVGQLYAACLMQEHMFIINYDDQLVSVDSQGVVKELVKATTGHGKMTPFVAGHELYFTSNVGVEYDAIYKIDFSKIKLQSEIVYRSDADLKLPKLIGGELYFLEIIHSEYLLKSINLKTKKKRQITAKGVVYNYDFDINRIVFSYSDLNTPKSINVYNLASGSIQNLTAQSRRMKFFSRYIAGSSKRSPAYIISPVEKQANRGVVLYIHPGLHSDFSPRWDSILMNLSENGYVLVCPNFPMSIGYGKSYYDSNIDQALDDLLNWKRYIHKNYDLPIYFLTSSSGNVLMELSLAEDDSLVKGAASLFGVPSAAEFTSVPTLYLLGKNDPVVDFASRKRDLDIEKRQNYNIETVIFSDEGHWFRNEKNLKKAVEQILSFYKDN